MVFSYTTCLEADNNVFKETCSIIEKNINGIIKQKPLIDVDGSIIQEYYVNSQKIAVHNDYEVYAVYVDSDIRLDEFIKSIV